MAINLGSTMLIAEEMALLTFLDTKKLNKMYLRKFLDMIDWNFI
jgi:hypothetical protein